MNADNPRARDLGIEIGSLPTGRHNAITDVAGVRVGSATIVEGTDVRTGITLVVPPFQPTFAGCHRLNGAGEMTGLEWVRESGFLTGSIAITNTHSVGVVRDAMIAERMPDGWYLPVVAETFDGDLNDVNGQHVKPEHLFRAVASAAGGAVAEGNVGGGTGMVCHGFKGGTGTASRVLSEQDGGWTVGVLVQTNHGERERLTIDGVPVGSMVPEQQVPVPRRRSSPGEGSIIIVVATDAPLLPGQLDRLALRASFGVARTGGAGENLSGDLIVAFSTGNASFPGRGEIGEVRMISHDAIDALFYAVIESTEEAIVNSLVAAETMTGRHGVVARRIDHELLRSLFSQPRTS
jgi:D-aminopeptidase